MTDKLLHPGLGSGALREALTRIADGPMSRECSYCVKTSRYSDSARIKLEHHKEDCPIRIAAEALALPRNEFKAERLAAIPNDVDTLISRAIYGESVADVRRKVAGYLERALSLSSPIEHIDPVKVLLETESPSGVSICNDKGRYDAAERAGFTFASPPKHSAPPVPTLSQASLEIRERENGESNLPWLQRQKMDRFIGCGQHGDRYGEDSQVWNLTCERCAHRFDAIVRILDALAPSRQGAAK